MGNTLVKLSEVLITPQLADRIPRPYTAESDAIFEAIDQKIKNGDKTALQDICDAALKLCNADSAGISLCGFWNDEPVFNWHVVAGSAVTHKDHMYSPRFGTPCGTVLDLFSYQMFRHPEKHYSWVKERNFIVPEMITMPIYLDNHEPFGTFWLTHQEGRHFDREDIRITSILVALIRKSLNNPALRKALTFS